MSSRLRLSAVSRFAALVVLAGAGMAPAGAAPVKLPPAYGASGSYLAAIVANAGRDSVAAAEFFRDALKADPRNATLLDQSFVSELVNGNMEETMRLAEKAAARDPSNALVQVVLSVRAMRARQFEKARLGFEKAARTLKEPDLAMTLFRAFAIAGEGQPNRAMAALERFESPDSRVLRDYFSGLIADLSGKSEQAETLLAAAHKGEGALMRVVDAYARVLTRRGKSEEAVAVLTRWKAENPTQPFLDSLLERVRKGEKLAPLAATAPEGLAEVFYMLGALGQNQRDPANAMIYMQMARYLSPKEEIYALTLGEFYEQMREHARAAELYGALPPESPYATRAAIGRAVALDKLDKHEEAIGVLKALLASHPADYEAADTLGAILRVQKRWKDTIEVYDAALKALPKLEERHFVLLFGRGIGYERLKMWPKAEPDFVAALDLLPKKPRSPREAAERSQVMNYLAYSWVDNGMNIEKSFEMLREAVSLTPGDGAVVDSLGWAYFRLGKYADAVRELERAVLLKAGDATINDHLGDAYFKVGRTREAQYKWRQALELNPEPEDAAKIRLKLDKGFDAAKANGG